MPLSYFDSIGKIWRKAEREHYRAIHARSAVHQADHFFNFSVTAHSLREYYFAHQGTPPASQTAYHDLWNQEPVLVAVREIANRSKHFTLRRPARTRGLRAQQADFVDVYLSGDRRVFLAPREAPSISICVDDGSRFELWEFTSAALRIWRHFLRSKGIRVRRQTVGEFLGGDA